MKHYNQAVIVGELHGKVFYSDVGENKKASFTLVEKNKFGESERIRYVPIVAWNLMADYVRNCEIGMIISVIGYVETDSYEKDGQKHYKTFVRATNVMPIIPL